MRWGLIVVMLLFQLAAPLAASMVQAEAVHGREQSAELIGLNDVVVFGGGIIPEDDRAPLFDAGVRAIFGPGTPSTEILEFVEYASQRDCGVGSQDDWHWGE